MVSTQDLKQKEVINIENGRSLGFVEDIVLNMERGTVEGLVIPQQTGGLFSFFHRGGEIVVPWNSVRRVGEEVILVDLGHPNVVEIGREAAGFQSELKEEK